MVNLILYLIIFLSLVGLGIILYRKIPKLARLSGDELTILEKKKSILQRAREVNYKEHGLNLMIWLEKFLRRLRLVFLKIENILNKLIGFLRNKSQIMTQKSKEWIRQREARQRKIKEKKLSKTKQTIPVKIEKKEIRPKPELPIPRLKELEDEPAEEDEVPISELKKPIREEQKWIDLIVENPKNITAYKFLGLLYYKQHSYTDAKASLDMAVKLGSKDKKVREVLKQLKRMGIK